MAKVLRTSTPTVRRGLYAAERAGLVEVFRAPGRKIVVADIAVMDPVGLGTEGIPPLRGPIVWRWLGRAVRLSGPALPTAMACWLSAEDAHSARFELTASAWSDLGLSRFAIGQGLQSLESVGLVAVDRGRGRRPVVTILDVKTPGPGA
jgi:hypothetical protein